MCELIVGFLLVNLSGLIEYTTASAAPTNPSSPRKKRRKGEKNVPFPFFYQ